MNRDMHCMVPLTDHLVKSLKAVRISKDEDVASVILRLVQEGLETRRKARAALRDKKNTP